MFRCGAYLVKKKATHHSAHCDVNSGTVFVTCAIDVSAMD
jgi:hypothetical protein